jgi:hypothetical protein
LELLKHIGSGQEEAREEGAGSFPALSGAVIVSATCWSIARNRVADQAFGYQLSR